MAKQKGRSKAGSGGSGGPGRIFYVILGVVALGGVAFLLLAGGGEDGGGLDRPLPAWASNVEADAGAGVALGPEDAPVTVTEFADYQCPHCAQFAGFTGRLLRQNYVAERGLVRWVLYDYLVGFQNSIPAAIAARCAGDQDRYWVMHDLILANQTEWASSGSPGRHFRDYADELGLDGEAFAECLDERRHLEAVMASHQYGVERGVRGTPTLFVNGERVDDLAYQALEARIQAAAGPEGGAADAPADGG